MLAGAKKQKKTKELRRYEPLNTYRSYEAVVVTACTATAGCVDRVDDLRPAAVGHHVPIGSTVLTLVLEAPNLLRIFDEAPCAPFHLERDRRRIVQPIPREAIAVQRVRRLATVAVTVPPSLGELQLLQAQQQPSRECHDSSCC